MTDTTELPEFSVFEEALRRTKLPGTANPRFRRDAYNRLRRCSHFQFGGQLEAKRLVKHELRPFIGSCDALLKALDKFKDNWVKLRDRAEKIPAQPDYWKALFAPTEEAIVDLRWSIQKTRQNAVGQVPTPLRKKGEAVEFEPLLSQHDYPLPKLGWKPAETWLTNELDNLISKYAKSIAPKTRHELIRAIFALGLKENKDPKAIAMALSRNKSISPNT